MPAKGQISLVCQRGHTKDRAGECMTCRKLRDVEKASHRPCLLCGEFLPYPAPRTGYHKVCRKFRDLVTGAAKSIKYKAAYQEYKKKLGCQKCGYNACGAALEFHHKDPASKAASIGLELWVIHTAKAQAEISKCILLCSNCHREHHASGKPRKILSVYLAAQFARKDEMAKKRVELENYGITVTSQWTDEALDPTAELSDVDDETNTEVANSDLLDIDAADVLVFFTEDPTVGIVRGGRHVELGYAFGGGKKVITVGPRENIFHFLPEIINFRTWKQAKIYLLSLYTEKPYKFTQQCLESDANKVKEEYVK